MPQRCFMHRPPAHASSRGVAWREVSWGPGPEIRRPQPAGQGPLLAIGTRCSGVRRGLEVPLPPPPRVSGGAEAGRSRPAAAPQPLSRTGPPCAAALQPCGARRGARAARRLRTAPSPRRGAMAVAVLRPLDAPLAELAPATALLLVPPPLCAALRGRGGEMVLAVRPVGRGGAQAVLLSAVALETGGRWGAELWLRGALLRRLGLAAGRRVAVWPVRRPPALAWVLLGAAGRAGRAASGAVLVRRGEALPGLGPTPGPLVLEARPALQGLLGDGTRTAFAAPSPPRESGADGAPCRRPAAPPLVSRFAAAGPVGAVAGPRLRAAHGGAASGGAEVWVSRRGLLALGLFQGEWVRVGSEEAARGHLAVLLARPPAWEYPRAARRVPVDGTALLSPALAFNLGCDPGATVHLCVRVS